jgi:NDP-sugar pyrophosphorylase family protein
MGFGTRRERNMKALILSAGLGTRLLPLTEFVPKPLVPVLTKPLIKILIDRLRGFGITGFGINLHHLPEMIKSCLAEQYGDRTFHFSFEPVILGTGGGIAGFSGFLADEDDFLVHNCDIISTIDIGRAVAFHRERKALATLILVDSAPTNCIAVAGDDITDIHGKTGRAAQVSRLFTYSGISIYSTAILETMPQGVAYSVIDHLIDAIRAGKGPILGYRAFEAAPYWRDIGNGASYLALHRDLLERKAFTVEGIDIPRDGRMTDATASVSPLAALEGFVSIGERAVIEEGARLKDAVVWNDTVVPKGMVVEGAVYAKGLTLSCDGGNNETKH